MIRAIVHIFLLGWVVLTSSGCFIAYSHRNRTIIVEDGKGSAPSGAPSVRFSHAVLAIYIPRAPDPVEAVLGTDGTATMILPAVTGWLSVGDRSTLIQATDIRRGAEIPMFNRKDVSTADLNKPDWWLKITKPEQAGARQPTTFPDSKSGGNDKSKPESEGRSQ